MSRPRRPLLVDDESHIGVLRQLQLEPRESTLRLAHTLGEARWLLANTPQLPDGLLLDLHLPDGFGLDWLAELRSSAATRKVPLIVPPAEDDESGRHLSTAPLPGRAR